MFFQRWRSFPLRAGINNLSKKELSRKQLRSNVANMFIQNQILTRQMSDMVESASEAWDRSCYVDIDYKISEDATVFDAVKRFSAYNIGCLVTTDKLGNISGVISERDYVNKIALLGKVSKETLIKEISTKKTQLITANPDDCVDSCMAKMLSRDIRHLPLINDDGVVVGILSIKDLIKSVVGGKEKTIETLSNFALGKGGHFTSD